MVGTNRRRSPRRQAARTSARLPRRWDHRGASCFPHQIQVKREDGYSAGVGWMIEALAAEIVAAEGELRGPTPEAWFARLDGGAARLEETLGWSLQHDQEQGLRVAGAVWPYWLARGRVDSGRQWLARLLEASEWGER